MASDYQKIKNGGGVKIKGFNNNRVEYKLVNMQIKDENREREEGAGLSSVKMSQSYNLTVNDSSKNANFDCAPLNTEG